MAGKRGVLCALVASAVQLCQANYVMGALGTNSCPAGFEPILEEAACRAAATALQYTFRAVETLPDRPRGCGAYPDVDGVWLNPHATGSAFNLMAPICETATTTTRSFTSTSATATSSSSSTSSTTSSQSTATSSTTRAPPTTTRLCAEVVERNETTVSPGLRLVSLRLLLEVDNATAAAAVEEIFGNPLVQQNFVLRLSLSAPTLQEANPVVTAKAAWDEVDLQLAFTFPNVAASIEVMGGLSSYAGYELDVSQVLSTAGFDGNLTVVSKQVTMSWSSDEEETPSTTVNIFDIVLNGASARSLALAFLAFGFAAFC